MLTGARAKRAQDYPNNSEPVHEMAVLTFMPQVADQLQDALLGGVGRKDPPCKLRGLVGKEASLIGKALSDFLGLLDGWKASGEHRKPCCILDLVNAPLGESSFCLWARAQVPHMAVSISRHCEVKFMAEPYHLAKLRGRWWETEEQRSAAQAMWATKECCLGAFARGVRRTSSSVEESIPGKRRLLLETSFAAMRMTTDWSERQNAIKRVLGRGLDFTSFARENLTEQTRAAHL